MKYVTGQEIDEAYPDDDMKFNLGCKAEDANGNEFVFVKWREGDYEYAGTEGKMLVGLDSEYQEFEGCCDPASGQVVTAIPQFVLGQLQATLTSTMPKGWAQYKGRNRKALVASGTINQGSRLSVSTSVSGAVITKAANTVVDIGVALEAASGNAIGIGEAHLQITI